MKLNLPSTLTREKMLTIFLLTFLQSNGVEAGRNFMNCLNRASSVSTNPYNNLVNFITTRNLVNGQEFCCDNYHDFSNCRTSFASCDRGLNVRVRCQEVGQAKFCLATANNLNFLENANSLRGLCGGVLGEFSLTKSISSDTCPNLVLVRNSLNKVNPIQSLS
jgi:hypothetical protein